MNRLLALLLAALAAQAPQTPQTAVDELLAVDRQFAAAGSKLGAAAAISAMFADDVAMLPVPREGFARGRAKAIEALEANADVGAWRAGWTPVRGGISADGQHGFTFGYMWLAKPSQEGKTKAVRVQFKYISYWVRQKEGWRVVVFKRRPAGQPASDAAPALMPPALPGQLVPPTLDAATVARHRDSLDATERAFSDEAQKLGIGAAFAKFGSSDAVNMGPPTESAFVVGAEAIGRMIGRDAPPSGSPVTWAPDRVIVASSGDLGVTLGFLRLNEPPPGGGKPPLIPFITVWRRASPSDPWRYVAE